MRILFLSTWFPYPPDNGSKIRVHHLLDALGRRHEVMLLSFVFDEPKFEQAKGQTSDCAEIRTISCNPMDRARLARAMRFLSSVPIVNRPIPEMTRLVRETLDRQKFDVVIASTSVMAVYALMVPPNVTKILEEHNSHSRWMWDRYVAQTNIVQKWRCWVSWQKTRAYESRLFRRFDLCTMVSEQDRMVSQSLLNGQGRVEISPNGVDCGRNYPGLVGKQPNTLIYNGALTYSANYEAMRYFLKEVYPLIRRQVPDISLTITGSTQGVDLGGLPLDESVKLSGYVEDVWPLVAGSTACVVPLQDGGGTRLKILEAMALGTPVVSTSKGAEGLNVADGENILVADDPNRFAELTLRLLRDEALSRQLVTNARRLVEERYNWDHIGCHFVRLVEETARRRGDG